MHVSPGIKEKYRPGMIGAVYSALWDDEQPMSVFAINRARRAANVLAITDQRVLTFQRISRLKYALVDSIDGTDLADSFVVATGPKRANISVFIGMDEIFLGTALRVSDAELRYIGELLRWLIGPHGIEPQVPLHELVSARAADREASRSAAQTPEAADTSAAQVAPDATGVVVEADGAAVNGTGTAIEAGAADEDGTWLGARADDGEPSQPGAVHALQPAATNGQAATGHTAHSRATSNGHGALSLIVSDEIVELARLHAAGVLSSEEFTAAKAALIAKI